MDKLIKWLNGKIERTSQLWYCWIGVICGIEILNITLVRKYAPFWCDVVISILLLSTGVYCISVFYRYIYCKYKNYLETNQFKILDKLSNFEKYIKELSEEGKKDLESKYTELSLKVSDYKSELKKEIDLHAKSTNANIEDKIKQLLENVDKLVKETNEAISHTNRTMNNAFENSNDLVVLKAKELADLTTEKLDKAEQFILNKFTNQMENGQKNLLILQNDIKDVSDSGLEGFNRVQTTVTETSHKINKSIDKQFERAKSNSNEKHDELNAYMSKVSNDLSVELKTMREENVNISNQIKKDVIGETHRISTDRHDKEMELIYKIFNQGSENHKGMIEQFEQAKDSIVENIDKEALAFNSNLITIQDVINEQAGTMANGIDTNQKQLEEALNKIITNTNTAVSNNQEKLSVQIREVAESVTTQIGKDKVEAIESTRQVNNTLSEVINNVFAKTETRIDENANMVTESLETTKDTINSLIALKQSEVLGKLEKLNKESTNNLKALLDIANSSVQAEIKELTGKIDDSSSVVNIMIDEVSTIKNEQGQISQSIDNLIKKEEKCQSVVEQAMDQFQSQLSLLQKETINEIAKSANVFTQLMIVDKDERNEVINIKFNNAYQQITELTEILSNRIDRLDASVAKTVSIAKAIEESEIRKGDRLFDMLRQTIKKDNELALSAKSISVKQEEVAIKIRNIETQMLTLNNLVKILKKVTSQQKIYKNEAAVTKQDPNRKEKIYDDESGITVFNTFNNDVLQYSEMQQLGRKVFSADYDSKGSISSSKNYDNQGEVIIENSYYSNGQVKERIEKIKDNGKMVTQITRFDANGRKLS